MSPSPTALTPTLALLAAACSAAQRAEDPGTSCNEARAVVEAVKRAIVQEVIPDELTYSIGDDGNFYIVVGSYREPTAGFAPTARVDRQACSVTDVEWR